MTQRPGKSNFDAIVKNMIKGSGLSVKEGEDLAEEIVESIKKGMLRKETVEIRGFGTFKARHRKDKWARDVKKGTKVFVPGHYSPVFIPGKVLKDALNEKPGDEIKD